MSLVRSPALVVAGLAATGVLSISSSMIHRAGLVAALGGPHQASGLPAPLWAVVMAAMVATYTIGLGAGWLLWGRRK